MAGVASPNIRAPGVVAPPVIKDCERARRLVARSRDIKVGAGLRDSDGAAVDPWRELSAVASTLPV